MRRLSGASATAQQACSSEMVACVHRCIDVEERMASSQTPLRCLTAFLGRNELLISTSLNERQSVYQAHSNGHRAKSRCLFSPRLQRVFFREIFLNRQVIDRRMLAVFVFGVMHGMNEFFDNVDFVERRHDHQLQI